MERFHPRGIDADGYILTVPNVEVQPQFQDLLVDVCMTLARNLCWTGFIFMAASLGAMLSRGVLTWT
jgi:hypothetical protein